MAKKKTKKERQEALKIFRFYEALSLCGDEKQAARLVGLGMQKAYRALADPDGISKLEKHNQQNHGTYYTMSREEREAFLTKCILFGAMPRVVYDPETGEPGPDLLYEPMDQKERLKCLDMINKMDGIYVEKREIVDKTPKDGATEQMTPEMREKLDEIYGDTGRKEEPEEDPLAL